MLERSLLVGRRGQKARGSGMKSEWELRRGDSTVSDSTGWALMTQGTQNLHGHNKDWLPSGRAAAALLRDAGESLHLPPRTLLVSWQRGQRTGT